MLSAAVRVLARAAAIQLEEAAARSARPPLSATPSTALHPARPGAVWADNGKGKGKARETVVDPVAPNTPPRSAPSISGDTRPDLPDPRRSTGPARRPIVTDKVDLGELREPGPSFQPRPTSSTSERSALPRSHVSEPAATRTGQTAVPLPSKAAGGGATSTGTPIELSEPATAKLATFGETEMPDLSPNIVPVVKDAPLITQPPAKDEPALDSLAGPSKPAATKSSRVKEPELREASSKIAPVSKDEPPIAQTPPARAEPALDTPDPVSLTNPTSAVADTDEDEVGPILRASRVPSSRIGRLFHYGSLAASLSLGAAGESFRRSATGEGKEGSVFMSDANVRRLVAALGKMRGAALKLGQFMSIQDNNILPPEIEKVLHQVQAHADYMPDWQLEQVMRSELGSSWESLFSSFSRVPIASASIGQVHRAVLASTGLPVAVKVQFPGIASSISSDLSNLSILLRGSAVLPRGLYLQNTIAVMRRELADECDYVREAEAGRRFGRELAGDDFFVVPQVVDEATTEKVLTTEWMSGRPLSRMKGMSQAVRDKIGTNILRLCLVELFQLRFMQTDPNWANFMYDAPADRLQLIDFGASREYTREFMDGWWRLLSAGLSGDRGAMKVESERLGYLTGEEGEEMVQAHLDSMALVASPFSYEGKYPFANQTITDSVRALIPIMLRQRLTPPPPETYSLNRKLSGAFLMCARLGAHVNCKKLWEDHAAGYRTVEMEQREQAQRRGSQPAVAA